MKRINYLLLLALIMGFINNCGNSDSSIDSLKKNLSKKKEELINIKTEIKNLERKINLKIPKNARKDNRVLVNSENLTYKPFVHYITQNGSIEAVQEAFISPEINGQIKKIFVKEGMYVKKGQILLRLNSNILEGGIKELKTNLKLAKIIFIKRKNLWKKSIGSEVQYLQAKTNMESMQNKLETLYAQLEMSKIKAPINGVIEKIFRKEGELASPGMQLIQLVNLDKLYINTDVSEKYLSAFKIGDIVQLNFPYYPNLNIKSKIYFMGNSVNIKNRTFKIKVLIDNFEGKLKPNNLVILKMKDFSNEKAIIIPSKIIKRDIKGDYVYVVKNENGKEIARKKYLKLGLSNEGYTMILSGLKIGEKIILRGYNMVKNGIEVKYPNKNYERKSRKIEFNN